MFFKPRVYRTGKQKLFIDRDAQLVIPEQYGYLKDKLHKTVLRSSETAGEGDAVVKKVICDIGIPNRFKYMEGKNKQPLWTNKKKNMYVITASDELAIYASDYTGLVYAVSTLERLVREESLTDLFLFDYPESPMRGYRTFIPSRDGMNDFKFMVDRLLVDYRYNYLVMELGGAMEYKRHPEINQAWEKYCAEMSEYSGKASEIQHKLYPWRKNSVHIDNGGGSWLTQEELRAVKEYCKERGIEIIPEVPCLSHCDYMLLTNPEIRERQNDEWPDTYCPSNPKSYELLYDILDEVVDVFSPRFIHIDHDEIKTLGVCEKCAKRDPVDLLVEDVTKIHGYLKNKRVRCIMSCDNLLRFMDQEGFCQFEMFGEPFGGTEYGIRGDDWYNPPTYQALGRIPKDIILAHWLWDEDYDGFSHEQELLKNGHQFIYFNMDVIRFEHYRDRMKLSGLGGLCSNWGSFSPEYMQKNLQTFNLVFSSYAYWSSEYDDAQKEELFEMTTAELCKLTEEQLQIDKKNYIEFLHSTDYYIPYKFFYDGDMIEKEKYILGHYLIAYTDGTEKLVEVKYGFDISNRDIPYNIYHSELIEMIGRTYPVQLDGKLYYRLCISNPCPD